MKLAIQIPCHNEAATLEACIADLPKHIPGIDAIELVVIDDGSSDETALVARRLGVQHVISMRGHKGLAQTFARGIEVALQIGADLIVNTDGDNQYRGQDVPALIAPILQGRADVVIGDRQVDQLSQFSRLKKMLHKLGNSIVQLITKNEIRDVSSGFRAYSREAALRTIILTDYSYTIENIIQLSKLKLRIVSVPVTVNPKLRKSRLIKSIPHFIGQQGATIVRTYATYSPIKVFLGPGVILILIGVCGLLAILLGRGRTHPVVLGGIFLVFFSGSLLIGFGVIAELIAINRKLIETILFKIKQLEIKRESGSHDEN